MPLVFPEEQQDSIQIKTIPVRDSVAPGTDTASTAVAVQLKDSVPHRVKRVLVRPSAIITDTISVCRRNSIADVTFYDPSNMVTRIVSPHIDQFPVLFIEKNRIISKELRANAVRHLRPGKEIPYITIHGDWLILVVLLTAFLFAFIKKSAANMIQGLERFFLFRGITDPSSRDIGGLFNWESTVKNLLSFLVLGMFVYSAAASYNLIPYSIPGIVFWLLAVAVIIIMVTIRHIICLITGSISDEREIFTEYLISIYQFYRFSALLIFVLNILMIYTTLLPVRTCLIAGLVVLMIFYSLRILRLLIIFINKNISLFYMILYLCALEILPVVISVKYISGFI